EELDRDALVPAIGVVVFEVVVGNLVGVTMQENGGAALQPLAVDGPGAVVADHPIVDELVVVAAVGEVDAQRAASRDRVAQRVVVAADEAEADAPGRGLWLVVAGLVDRG